LKSSNLQKEKFKEILEEHPIEFIRYLISSNFDGEDTKNIKEESANDSL